MASKKRRVYLTRVATYVCFLTHGTSFSFKANYDHYYTKTVVCHALKSSTCGRGWEILEYWICHSKFLSRVFSSGTNEFYGQAPKVCCCGGITKTMSFGFDKMITGQLLQRLKILLADKDTFNFGDVVT